MSDLSKSSLGQPSGVLVVTSFQTSAEWAMWTRIRVLPNQKAFALRAGNNQADYSSGVLPLEDLMGAPCPSLRAVGKKPRLWRLDLNVVFD